MNSTIGRNPEQAAATPRPEKAASLAELSTTPDDAVHGAALPVSNPGLPSFCPGLVQPPPPPPEMVKVKVADPEPPADLVTSNVVGPDQSFDGKTITVSYHVSNLGLEPTDKTSWTDTIWLAQDKDRPHPGHGDILLKTLPHTGALVVKADGAASGRLSLRRRIAGARAPRAVGRREGAA